MNFHSISWTDWTQCVICSILGRYIFIEQVSDLVGISDSDKSFRFLLTPAVEHLIPQVTMESTVTRL